MAQLFDVGQEECSVIFLWTYVVATVAVTVWYVLIIKGKGSTEKSIKNNTTTPYINLRRSGIRLGARVRRGPSTSFNVQATRFKRGATWALTRAQALGASSERLVGSIEPTKAPISASQHPSCDFPNPNPAHDFVADISSQLSLPLSVVVATVTALRRRCHCRCSPPLQLLSISSLGLTLTLFSHRLDLRLVSLGRAPNASGVFGVWHLALFKSPQQFYVASW
ncbi:hypothetical protein C4D60_Mb10t21310 [Musa balbisiana]|uniref:Uncharacterized protein n=1 Tax=Musa balbisiana TaxID=52838 RepID=A0A4V4H506_MUSBA|nr:hypothetical protein C4D60_Mb10t21310 [Musa balbisiana]